MNAQQFQNMLQEKGISLSPEQMQQFERYYELLIEWNEKNESNSYCRKKEEVYLKHFF
ncbi:hypothetical protein GCM10020331_019900 [Ectobacillus funiculus]